MATADFVQPVGQRTQPVPQGQPKPSGQGVKIVVIVLAVVGVCMVAVIGLLALIAVPAFMRNRDNARKIGCVNNLRQIDAAKEMFVVENGGEKGKTLTWDNLAQYINMNRIYCPSAPVDQRGLQNYSIEPVGTDPKCLVVGAAGGHNRNYR